MDQEDEFEELTLGSSISIYNREVKMTSTIWKRIKNSVTLDKVKGDSLDVLLGKHFYSDGHCYRVWWRSSELTNFITVYKSEDKFHKEIEVPKKHEYDIFHFDPITTEIYYTLRNKVMEEEKERYCIKAFVIDLKTVNTEPKLLYSKDNIIKETGFGYFGSYGSLMLIYFYGEKLLMWLSKVPPVKAYPILPDDHIEKLGKFRSRVFGRFYYYERKVDINTTEKVCNREICVYDLKEQICVNSLKFSPATDDELTFIKVFPNFVLVRYDGISAGSRLIASDKKLRKVSNIIQTNTSRIFLRMTSYNKNLFGTIRSNEENGISSTTFRLWTVVNGLLDFKDLEMKDYTHSRINRIHEFVNTSRKEFCIKMKTDYALNLGTLHKYKLSF